MSFRSLSRCFRNDDFEIARQGGSEGARKETNGDGANVATRMAEAEGDGRTGRKGESAVCGACTAKKICDGGLGLVAGG